MPEVVSLDLPPGQGFEIGIGEGTPDGAGGIAIGEATAEGEDAAVLVEPMLNVPCEQTGTIAKPRAAVVVAFAQASIEQAVEVHRERDVVGDAADDAVAVPTVAEIEPVEFIEIG